MYTYYISVGSNMGDRAGYIEQARRALVDHMSVHHIVSSSLMETAPWGFTEQQSFINALWAVTSDLEPHDMLAVLQGLEAQAQRQRKIHWGPRTLDLDIVYAIGESGSPICCDDAVLTVPHPYFWERLFVLEPLRELVPTFVYQGESIDCRIQNLRGEYS